MRISTPGKTIAFFITLGALLVVAAIALNVSWILFHWRQVVPLVFGIIVFAAIIAGLVLNTTFLVREIRRNEQQDSFLNAVTHELKTPIASIRLYLETLQRRELNETQRREFYQIMLQDTDRLLATIEQVLKAGEARLATNRKNYHQVDFGTVVSEAVDLARVRHQLSAEELQLTTLPEQEVVVLGNADELRAAVLNLLDNAVKYSGAEPRISVRMRLPDLDSVRLRVGDRGMGIPQHELKRIFKRFHRVNHSGSVKGTGLGLFIVRSIARQHGGDITARSAGEGKGAIFTLRLPRVHRA